MRTWHGLALPAMALSLGTPVYSAQDFNSCVDRAVNGSSAHDCSSYGEANSCVGLRRAVENSEKHDRCLKPGKSDEEGCALYAYKQNSQPVWVSVAAGHLQRFTACVNDKYAKGDEDAAAAYARALKDEEFMELLKKTNDGSARFGLRIGEVLERALRGESFSDVIRLSPVGKKMKAAQLLAFTAEADSPTLVNTEDSDPKLYGESTNPAQEGDRFGVSLKGDSSESISMAQSTGAPNPGVVIFQRKTAAIDESRTTFPIKAANTVPLARTADSPYSLGLDLSLFQRVSKVYRKKSQALKNWEDFVARSKTPRDQREFLRQQDTAGVLGL